MATGLGLYLAGDLVVDSVVCVLRCLVRVVLVLGCLAFGMCFGL